MRVYLLALVFLDTGIASGMIRIVVDELFRSNWKLAIVAGIIALVALSSAWILAKLCALDAEPPKSIEFVS